MRHARPALARPALRGLACLSALALAAAPAHAGIFGPKKKSDAAAAPAASPSSGAPPVAALPGPVLQAAGAYRIYMRRAAAVGASHAGSELEGSLQTAERSEPVGLTKGEVAYAAVIALQEPSFVEGVRAYAGDPVQRRTIVDRLAADPSYVNAFAGASAAATAASRALAADGARVADAGRAVKQSAYDMQKQSWSKSDIPDRPGRLARAKTLAATPMAATPEEMSALAASDAGGPTAPVDPSGPAGSGPPFSSTVQHGLAIAALAALGETGDANDAVVQTLLNDSAGAYCHSMAKLNLYQCLAVAKPYYEDAFCLGQHVLLDTGQCVMKAAGVSPPAPPPAALAEAAPKPATKSSRRKH